MVQSAGCKSKDEGGCSVVWQRTGNNMQLAKLIRAGREELVYVQRKTELMVKNYSQIPNPESALICRS